MAAVSQRFHLRRGRANRAFSARRSIREVRERVMAAPSAPMLLLPLLLAAVPLSSPTTPIDDPEFARCLEASDGVRLAWEPPGYGLRVYLLVKRLDENGNWRVWLRTERANPPFTLTPRASA